MKIDNLDTFQHILKLTLRNWEENFDTKILETRADCAGWGVMAGEVGGMIAAPSTWQLTPTKAKVSFLLSIPRDWKRFEGLNTARRPGTSSFFDFEAS